MADVFVSVGKAGHLSTGRAQTWTGQVRSEIVQTTGTETAVAGALVANDGDVFKVFCETAVYASAVGDASASNGVFVPASQAEYIGASAGATISVVDAA